MLILLALACTDPEFGHLGESLSAYEDGRVAMTTGAPLVAAEAFARAGESDPTSDLLVAWEARALRAAGEQGRALSRLNAGVSRFPGSALLRYDRAAIRSRNGDLGGAAEDLRWLYANEKANPIEVGEDPDFLALRTDPTTKALVPLAQVEASVEAQAGSVLIGERFVLDFRITSRTGSPVDLKLVEEAPQPLMVKRIVEDVLEEGPIWSRRWIRAEVVATNPGRSVVGPWLVGSAGTTAITERVIIEAVALDGRSSSVGPDSGMLKLEVPSTRWAQTTQPFIGVEDDGVWAVFPAGMDFRPSTHRVGLRMELRVAGQPKWSAVRISEESGGEVWSNGQAVARLK